MSDEQIDLMLSIASTYQRYMGQPVTELAEYDPEVFHLMCKEVTLRVGDAND